ncbi:MAG: acetoacetyl-CoA synthase [Spirochaetaceae bacterium]|nr:MAG: acetoacetyl-CoA synthase [Spirochaetaceae bacterium]
MNRKTKVRTNLTVDPDLLKQARERGVSLSAVFEHALRQTIAEHEARGWQDENRNALSEYAESVRERGVFSDGLRSF